MESIQELLERWGFVKAAVDIWKNGGWAMIALAINAFILFVLGANLWLNMKLHRRRPVREKKWRRWLTHPEERKGSAGELMTAVLNEDSLHDMDARFEELRATEMAPFNRDLKFMKRAVSTAPLLGLLGTVTGMLSTFSALGSGSGGGKAMDQIAAGISEALITTETGLVIALPGLFFQYYLTRKRDLYLAFLARLETACAQFRYHAAKKKAA